MSGDVRVDYRLIDSTSDPVDIAVEYSTDGGTTFFLTTLVATDDGLIFGNAILDQSSNPGGYNHWFEWDSLTDLGAGTFNVILRITPCDAFDCGLPDDLGPLFVSN